MTLGERIIQSREAKGLSQIQLAKLIGISQQSLQVIESGDTKNPRRLEKMAKVLEVDPGWLHYGTTSVNSYEKTPHFTWEQIKDSVKNPKALEINSKTSYINFPKPSPKSFALTLYKDTDTIEPSNDFHFATKDILIVNPDILPTNNDLVIVMKSDWFQPAFLRYIMSGSEHYLSHTKKLETKITKDTKICGVVVMRISYLV